MDYLKLAAIFVLAAYAGCGSGGSDRNEVEIRSLGRQIFFDTALSTPAGQSCGSCHVAERAFSDPISEALPTSEGAVAGLFGARNTPTISYAMFAPAFGFNQDEQDFIGGQFLDGRAADLRAQAKKPFFEKNEMNNSSAAELIEKIRRAPYAGEFLQAFGAAALDDPDQALEFVAQAIGEFEQSPEVNPFSSRFDRYRTNRGTLNEQELRGLTLFDDPKKGNCAACHPSTPREDNVPPLFTDHTYDNLGVPANFENPFLAMPSFINPEGSGFRDLGLQKTTGRPEDSGRIKVPTLRNAAKTAPYFHNGVFRTLKEVVHFYNSRDPEGVVPEVASGVNRQELGNLRLTPEEEDDIVAFLGTLTDGE